MTASSGVSAYLIREETFLAGLTAASAAGAPVPAYFLQQHGDDAWPMAIAQLIEHRGASEPLDLEPASIAALHALLIEHGRKVGEIACTRQQFSECTSFLGSWLPRLLDGNVGRQQVMPGNFLGLQSRHAEEFGSILPATIAASPSPRAAALVDRLRMVWTQPALDLVLAIKRAAAPDEHAVLMPFLASEAEPEAEDPRTPVTSMVWLFLEAVELGASDFQVSAGAPPLMRFAGRFQALDVPPISVETVRKLSYTVMTDLQISDFEKRGLACLGFGIRNVARVRMVAAQQRGTVSFNCHLLPTRAGHWPLDDLGYRLEPELRPGLTLVAGPAGTGRTCTAHAIIDAINRSQERRISTIEAPIELVHANHRSIVTQYDIGGGEDLTTFADGVIAARESLSDVVLLDHVDTRERLEAACAFALGGAFVVATMRAEDARIALLTLQASMPAALPLLQALLVQHIAPGPDGGGRVSCEILGGAELQRLREGLVAPRPQR